jgi:hypothetical protein
LAIPSVLRFALCGRRRQHPVLPTQSPFEFRLRLEPCPTKPSRPHRSEVDSSHGLSFPTAHQDSKVHRFAGFACPLCSVLRVWLPSRRFTPFEPLPVLFRTGGAPGISPSKRSPLERWSGVSAQPDPLTVSLSVLLDVKSSRPVEPRFLGFSPFESPWRTNALLTRRPLDAPLGFTPSRVFQREPCSRFRPNSFLALGSMRPEGTHSTRASKYQSTPAWHLPMRRTGRTCRKTQPS